MPASQQNPNLPEAVQKSAQPRGRAKLLLVLLICAAPIIASYYTYYFVRPSARSNYGELIEPQRPIPQLTLRTLDGHNFDPAAFKGKWMMLIANEGDCDEACVKRLFFMRQLRVLANKDQDRIERVWLITDEAPLSTTIIRAYDGTHMLRADAAQLKAWLPPAADHGAEVTEFDDHIYMVDPLGNLMMRFPKDADPAKMKKDLTKLLKASSVG